MNIQLSYKSSLKLPLHFFLLILVFLSGCSTVVEGRSQQIQVTTAPAGASCTLKSNDDVIGIVPSTPGTITVEKSKYDIIVECTKEGYLKGKSKDHSDYAISSLGNLAFMQLSFIGNMVDSATGASNKYDTQVYVALEKAPDQPVVAQLPVQQSAAVATPVQYIAGQQAPASNYQQYVAPPIAQYTPPQPASMEVAQLYIPQPIPDTAALTPPVAIDSAKQAPFE